MQVVEIPVTMSMLHGEAVEVAAEEEIVTATETGTVTNGILTPKVAAVAVTDGATANGPIGINLRKVSPAAAVSSNRRPRSSHHHHRRRRHSRSNNRSRKIAGRTRWRTARRRTTES